MSRYLTDRDYGTLIRREILDLLKNSDPQNQLTAEEYSKETISSYLRGKYDIDKVFHQIDPYQNATAYVVDEYVFGPNGLVYKCIQAGTGQPTTDTDYWTKEDPRFKLIIRAMIDLTLYDLHSTVQPRNIPDLRVKRYDDTMSWLKGAQKGTVDPGLVGAVIEGSESGTLRFGSATKRSEDW